MKMTRTAALTVVLVLAGTAASAGIADIPLLAKIIAVLSKVAGTLHHINGVLEDTKHKLENVYPDRALRKVEILFNKVKTIRSQVEELSCGWRFSVRAARLWDGLFKGAHFCRPEWQAIFGAPPAWYSQDLDEYYDSMAVLRTKMVADRVSKADNDEETIEWLLHQSMLGRDPAEPGETSPGWWERLNAMGTIMMAKQQHDHGDLIQADLLLEQERAMEKAKARRAATNMALFLYESLRRGNPGSAAEASEARR